MIISYFDMKYELRSALLFTYFLVTLIFFGNIRKLVKTPFCKVDKMIMIYVIVFCSAFSIFFSFLPCLIFKHYSINQIGEYSVYSIIKTLVISPILEEIIFRGGLFKLLLKNTSRKKAQLLCSLGFTLVHYQSDSSLLAIFGLSLFLCYIFLKTKNILLCIIAHALNNFLSVAILPFFVNELKTKESYVLIILVISVVIILFSVFKIYKNDKQVNI